MNLITHYFNSVKNLFFHGLIFILPIAITFALFKFCFNLFFLFDIVLNFLTAFIDEDGKLVYKYKKIAKAYIRGTFFIDFISIIPFAHFYEELGHLNKLIRLISYKRIYKI